MKSDRELLEQVKDFYENYHSRRQPPVTPWLRESYWSEFYGTTLEIGGGTVFPDRDKYTLVDLSHTAARQAALSGVPSLIADGGSLPFQDRSFDTVACHDVLEHVLNPRGFLAELCRVARKRVVISGPNWVGEHLGGLDRNLPRRLWLFLAGRGKEPHYVADPHLTYDENWYPDHDALCKPNAGFVSDVLKQSGFKTEKLRSWEHAYPALNHIPLVRCLGQYMLVVGER